MTKKSCIKFNHQKVVHYFRVQIMVTQLIIIMVRKVMKREAMRIMVNMVVMRMVALIKMVIIMDNLSMRMDLLYHQVVSPRLNTLKLRLKNLKKLGTLKYLESLVIPILQSVLDIIW